MFFSYFCRWSNCLQSFRRRTCTLTCYIEIRTSCYSNGCWSALPSSRMWSFIQKSIYLGFVSVYLQQLQISAKWIGLYDQTKACSWIHRGYIYTTMYVWLKTFSVNCSIIMDQSSNELYSLHRPNLYSVFKAT